MSSAAQRLTVVVMNPLTAVLLLVPIFAECSWHRSRDADRAFDGRGNQSHSSFTLLTQSYLPHG